MYELLSPYLQRYTEMMTGETIGTQVCSYSIAVTSLAIALRRIRPFSRFKNPSDVPKLFIRKRQELSGVVSTISPNGGLLMVQHVPVVQFSSKTVDNLPVKIAGVDVTGHGINWLQTIVAGNKVKFIPVEIEEKWVQCEVTMEQLTFDKKPRTINIGESLVGIGFGKLSNEVPTIKMHSTKYHGRLKAAENQAKKKELGIKYYLVPAQIMLINFMSKMFVKIKMQVQKLTVPEKKKITQNNNNKVALS